MYGMVHQAARGMVLERCDYSDWQSILSDCGLSDEHFLSAQCYNDDLTFALIGQIATYLDLEVNILLEQFGTYWLKFAESSKYSSILNMAGDDLETFLANLDRMHASIKSTMPDAEMPSFALLPCDEDTIRLKYSSKREGLEPFVKGLLRGLMARFGRTGIILTHAQEGSVLFVLEFNEPEHALAKDRHHALYA